MSWRDQYKRQKDKKEKIIWKKGGLWGKTDNNTKVVLKLRKSCNWYQILLKNTLQWGTVDFEIEKIAKIEIKYKNKHIFYDGKCGQVIKTLLKKKYTLF